MPSGPDFKQLAAAHNIELDKDASMLRVSGSDAEYFVATARDVQGSYWVLRAPRRGDVQAQARTEKLVLDFVRGKVPVVIPDWQVYSDKLIAYRVLPGIAKLMGSADHKEGPKAFAEKRKPVWKNEA